MFPDQKFVFAGRQSPKTVSVTGWPTKEPRTITPENTQPKGEKVAVFRLNRADEKRWLGKEGPSVPLKTPPPCNNAGDMPIWT